MQMALPKYQYQVMLSANGSMFHRHCKQINQQCEHYVNKYPYTHKTCTETTKLYEYIHTMLDGHFYVPKMD